MSVKSRSRKLALLFAIAFFFCSSTAWAIDGYKDRRGPFIGIGFGGGAGSVHINDDNFTSGLEGGGDLGLHLNVNGGGGVTENIVFGAELNTWIRTVSVHDTRLNHQHWSFNAVGEFFLAHGLFVDAGLGLAYAISEASHQNVQTRRYQEMGLALRAGTGFEYFLNGTVAAGLRFGYTRHFYENVEFDTFQGALTLRWY